MGEITLLLDRVRAGDCSAEGEVFGLLYQDLRLRARRYLGCAHRDVLDATVLVHECYLRMVREGVRTPLNKAHFLAVAATAMRHLLINHARDLAARRRGQGHDGCSLVEEEKAALQEAEELLHLEQMLAPLEEDDPRLVKVLECRVFAGYSEAETAQVMGVSERTVRRLFTLARDRLLITSPHFSDASGLATSGHRVTADGSAVGAPGA